MSSKRLPKTKSTPRNDAEIRLLKAIGRKLYKEVYDQEKPIEWLGFEAEVARSTVRRILDGENMSILTLDRCARALGYKDGIIGFLKDL